MVSLSVGHEKMIDFVVTDSGCFDCTSHATDGKHYPSIQRNRIKMDMHRFIFIECFGEIPKGLEVRHKCDNRNCINPEHLELGTRKDNARDMVMRGRSLKGSTNNMAKLTEEDVRFIRLSDLSCTSLAKKYGVTFGAISKIRLRTTWKHIE